MEKKEYLCRLDNLVYKIETTYGKNLPLWLEYLRAFNECLLEEDINGASGYLVEMENLEQKLVQNILSAQYEMGLVREIVESGQKKNTSYLYDKRRY